MLLVTAAPAQHRKTTKRARPVAKKKVSAPVSGAETGLVGIKLFDTGAHLVAVYGSPDQIEAVTLGGGGGAGPGGGAAGGAGGRGLPGRGGGSGGGGGATMQAQPTNPGSPEGFDFGDNILGQQIPDNQKPGSGAPTGGPPPGSVPQGPPGSAGGGPGPRAGGFAGGGGGGAGGGGGTGGTQGDRVTYTRWVYNRNGSKYGFILDRFNRVVQCEAIGIQSGKANTRRGITFGSTFAQIIKKYGAPDGYEIAGDNIVVRYLSQDKCAFRLTRLGENKPNVVTGIVVAAGKR